MTLYKSFGVCKSILNKDYIRIVSYNKYHGQEHIIIK